MSVIKAVIFDMDGVLFDTETICCYSWAKVGAVRHMDHIDQALIDCIGLNRNDGITVLKERYGSDFDAAGFLDEAKEENRRWIEEHGIPLKKGVREILSFLQEQKIPTAICSSTQVPTIQSHLQRSDLSGYFQQIIGGNMVEHSKPEPDIYQKACEAVGYEPVDCIAVEDSPNGIRSAYRAGMQVVMVPDLVASTPELLQMCISCQDSLLSLQSFLQNMLIS